MTNNNMPVAVPVSDEYHATLPATPVVANLKMIECYSLRRTVKLLCGINIFFGLLYSIYNPYFIIPALIASFGYYGAEKYNSAIILSYLIYITLDWILKLTLYIMATAQDPDSTNTTPGWWVLIILSTLIDIWISKIVYKFWHSLKKLPVLERSELKEMENIRHRFVYW